MTTLEQRFLETVPAELRKLNDNLSRLATLLEGRRTSTLLQDSTPLLGNNSIIDSDGAARLLREDLRNLDHEEVWILLLNSDMKPLRKERINMGNLTQTTLDTRRIVKTAIDNTAASVILYHNHPSGNPTPSDADLTMTSELRDALKLFSIGLNDHIIISGNGKSYYSFAEEQVRSLKNK